MSHNLYIGLIKSDLSHHFWVDRTDNRQIFLYSNIRIISYKNLSVRFLFSANDLIIGCIL